MKQLLSLILALLPLITSYAQVTVDDIPIENEFFHVFNSDIDVNIKMLNAKSWIATNFGDYKSVLQYEDDNNYRIIIKGKSPIVNATSSITYQYTFTMTFDFRDDRYRIRFEDIEILRGVSFVRNAPTPNTKLMWEEYFTYDTEKFVKERAKYTAIRDSLQSVLVSNSRMRDRDRERIEKELSKAEYAISYDDNVINNVADKTVAENILRFKTTFCDIVNSAVKMINTNDDF